MYNQFITSKYSLEESAELEKLNDFFMVGGDYTEETINEQFENTQHFLGRADYGTTGKYGQTIIYENPNTGDATYIVFTDVGKNNFQQEFTCLSNNL